MFENGKVISVYLNVSPPKSLQPKKLSLRASLHFEMIIPFRCPINGIPFGKRKVLILSTTHIEIVSSINDTHKHLGPRSCEIQIF